MPVPADSPLEAQERLDLMGLMDSGDYKIPPREVDLNSYWAPGIFSNSPTRKLGGL